MEVKSNMAGTILEVLVSVGDQIEDGQDLVCLESMKMQMFISSESSGTVKEIKIDIGDFVNEGDLLLLIE
ncbi:MAG: biotin/lipoyl-containing protein [Cyanobacteriota bacterium]